MMNLIEKRVRETLKFLQDRGFSRSKDILHEYSGNSIIYHKQLSDDTYLVFNHFNFNRKGEMQGFDVWLSQYGRASEIGVKPARLISNIKTAFHLPQDLQLLNNYL